MCDALLCLQIYNTISPAHSQLPILSVPIKALPSLFVNIFVQQVYQLGVLPSCCAPDLCKLKGSRDLTDV